MSLVKHRVPRRIAWVLVAFYAVAAMHHLGPVLTWVERVTCVPGIGAFEECCHGHNRRPVLPVRGDSVRPLAETCPFCALLQSDNIASTGCPMPDGLAATVSRLDIPDLPAPRASRWRLPLVRAPPLSFRQPV